VEAAHWQTCSATSQCIEAGDIKKKNKFVLVCMASLISAVSWIPKQAAAAKPVKYELTAGELKRVEYLAKVKLDDARIELGQLRTVIATNTQTCSSFLAKKMRLENCKVT